MRAATTLTRRLAAMAAAVALLVVGSVAIATSPRASAAGCPTGATMNVVAHQDDDLFFQNPAILREVRAGVCLRTSSSRFRRSCSPGRSRRWRAPVRLSNGG